MTRPVKVILGVLGLAVVSSVVLVSRLGPLPSEPRPAPRLGTPAPPMKLFVTTQLDAMQITNDTDATWDECDVAIEGGYTTHVALLRPHDTIRLAYGRFTRDRQPIPEGEGRLRAGRIDVSCAGPDYERHHQTFRQ